jgi:hypothetical protein
MYEDVIEEFEDKIDINDTFKSYSFTNAYNKIIESKTNLKFLIGFSGSGKSFLINVISKDIPSLIVNSLINKDTLDTIKTKDKLIIIDEAQLLDEKLIEYIRILSDEGYKFLLSMHKEDSSNILNKEHFKTREIDIIELLPITKEEMIQYLNVKLLKSNANHLFTSKEFNTIYKYTKGNFRYIKRFVKTLFELLKFANENNLPKYHKINSCLITMSAIHLGLENG